MQVTASAPPRTLQTEPLTITEVAEGALTYVHQTGGGLSVLGRDLLSRMSAEPKAHLVLRACIECNESWETLLERLGDKPDSPTISDLVEFIESGADSSAETPIATWLRENRIPTSFISKLTEIFHEDNTRVDPRAHHRHLMEIDLAMSGRTGTRLGELMREVLRDRTY
ncbi:MAG: hypothetical protein KDD55_03490 [Bdellovibrionales bacterium]|nr:hypothetical protein [Bdellovibrionales bacterium]